MNNEFDQFAENHPEIHVENVKNVGIGGVDSGYFRKYKIEKIYELLVLTQ